MIDYGTFDSHLMNRIQNAFKPYGFAYSIYQIDSGGPVRKAHNSHGYRNKSKDAISIHSVTEMDSMSKTITAMAMLKLISKVPEVRAAFDAAKSTTTGSSAWTTWNSKVNKYLDHKISGFDATALADRYQLESSPGGQDNNNQKSASAHQRPGPQRR